MGEFGRINIPNDGIVAQVLSNLENIEYSYQKHGYMYT
jgi:hypothetical protein